MGGSEDFGGDNLIFRKTKGEISRNCEPKKGRLLKTLKGFRGEGGTTQICLDNEDMGCVWGEGITRVINSY